MNPSLIEKAVRIATQAHQGQKRKDGPPYIIHPYMCALKLFQNKFSDVAIAAALVHDVLEDTSYTEEQLRTELGEEICSIVRNVTYDKSLSWEEQRMKYIDAVRQSSEAVRAVSIVDKIHNAESLLIAYAQEGPAIWKRFNKGKAKKIWFEKALLHMFKETWKHPLVDEYAELVEQLEMLEEI